MMVYNILIKQVSWVGRRAGRSDDVRRYLFLPESIYYYKRLVPAVTVTVTVLRLFNVDVCNK